MGKIDNYVNEIIRIANDNRHGYSQYNRWGNPDYDCSSLVITVTQNAGIPTKTYGATYTGNMYRAFLKAGFKDVTYSINLNTGAGLQKGDVLLNVNYHTEIYIGGGKTAGAKIDEYGDIVGRNKGDQTGREICVGWYYNYPWTHVLRYVGDNRSTSKKPTSTKAKKIKNEKWRGITLAVCNVRSAPSTSAKVVAQYGKDDIIYYDQVWEGDGYRWISYVGGSGKRRYVAYRSLANPSDQWIKF